MLLMITLATIECVNQAELPHNPISRCCSSIYTQYENKYRFWLFNGKRCLNFGISLIFTSILCVQAVKAQSPLYFSDNICDKNKSLTVSVEPVHEILFLIT